MCDLHGNRLEKHSILCVCIKCLKTSYEQHISRIRNDPIYKAKCLTETNKIAKEIDDLILSGKALKRL